MTRACVGEHEAETPHPGSAPSEEPHDTVPVLATHIDHLPIERSVFLREWGHNPIGNERGEWLCALQMDISRIDLDLRRGDSRVTGGAMSWGMGRDGACQLMNPRRGGTMSLVATHSFGASAS